MTIEGLDQALQAVPLEAWFGFAAALAVLVAGAVMWAAQRRVPTPMEFRIVPPKPHIEIGYVLARDIAEEKSGQPIIPRAFEWAPQGARMLVVVDLVPEKIGLIALTEEQQDMQQMGTGYIISVGPQAGILMNTQIGQVMVTTTPEALLGQHVMFGMHSGKSVRFSVFDSDYDSKLLLLAPLDVWMLDQNPEPYQFDKEYESAYVMTKQGIEDAASESLEVDRALLVRENELAFDKEHHGEEDEGPGPCDNG